MARNSADSPGVSVRLPVELAGDASKAAKHFGVSLVEYVTQATQQRIERDRETWKAERFAKAEADALRQNHPRPDPTRYGLPADYGVELEPPSKPSQPAAKSASSTARPVRRSVDQSGAVFPPMRS